MTEKRKQPRISVNWPVRITFDKKIISGKIKDISMIGVSVECDGPIQVGENIPVTIMPPGGKLINIVGKIVWSDCYALDMNNENATLAMGLSFVEISMKDRHILKEIIDIPVEKS
ncbi:PilZ domain-containing protein [Thermodesulfobacteriota bacterium]